MNDISLAAALATAPSSAFAELRERPRFWLPLVLVVLATAGLTYWYYSVVDIDWLKDLTLNSNPKFQEMSAEQRNMSMSMFTRNTMRFSSLIGICIFIPIVFLVTALYFFVAAKVTKVSLGFKHWFSLVCWTALPMLLTSVVAAILLLLADNPQISPSVLQPLSLNELALHRSIGSPGYALFESLSIPALLSWVLAIVGVHVWSQRSWAFSTIFVMLPWAIIYPVWIFFAFR